MSKLHPIIPPSTDHFIYPLGKVKTFDPSTSEYIDKEGKKYKVTVQTIHHDLPWKVWQGVQAFFLTVLSFGIAFAFQSFREAWNEKWNQALTGDEKVRDYKLISPEEDSQTSRINRLGATLKLPLDLPNEKIQASRLTNLEATLKPTFDLPYEVRTFIQTARNDISKISIINLQKGLNAALAVAADIKNPEDKTTLYSIAERIAQNHVEKDEHQEAFAIRLKAAQAIKPAGPLADLQIAMQKEDPKLGLKLHPVDTSLFKKHSLGVQKRKFTDGSTQLHFSAKLSHPARKKLKQTINSLEERENCDHLFNALPPRFCKSVTIATVDSFYQGRTNGAKKWEGDFSRDIDSGFTIPYGSQVIEFEGVGKITTSTFSPCLAELNHITIDLDPNISEAEASDKLNIIFAALGLGAVSSSSRAEDIERIKIMQLFRAFYPSEAYEFERSAASFEVSVESLKARIGKKVPEMKDKFKEYLVDHPEKMYQQEVYPGQSVWCVKGISDEVRNAGGLGLMAGVTGSSFEDATNRLVSMLKGGALSSQDRFDLGIIASGDSTVQDLISGGGDSVFARIITEKMPKDLNAYPLSGAIQILYDLDLVERGGYVYPGDKYGSKEKVDYKTRINVVQLTEKIEKSPQTYKGNEICIHHRVGPEFIKGVRVDNDKQKEELIKALNAEGLVTKNHLNQECFNNIPLDQFIRVGDVKAEYWA